MNWKLLAIAVFVFVIAIAVNNGVIYSERYFTSVEFCTSCHAMTYPYEALKTSVHWGRVGMNPGCVDCHFPPSFTGKLKVHIRNGIRDTISNLWLDLSTKEAFDKHREEFVERARAEIRGWDSAPCRECHKDPKPGSESGKAAHALMKGEGRGERGER